MTRDLWMSIASAAQYGRHGEYSVFEAIDYVIKTAPAVFRRHGKEYNIFCTYTLISLAFPPGFRWEKSIKDKETILIDQGILVQGSLGNEALGKSGHSIIKALHRSGSYGTRWVAIFTSVMQQIVQTWIESRGLTLSISDFVPSEALEKKIDASVEKSYRAAYDIGQGNVVGIYDKDRFVSVVQTALNGNALLTPAVLSGVINEVNHNVFNFMSLLLQRYQEGRTVEPFSATEPYAPSEETATKMTTAIKKSLTKVLKNRQLEETIFGIIYQPIMDFLGEQLSNPFDPKRLTSKSIYEQTRIELDIQGALRGAESNIMLEIRRDEEVYPSKMGQMVESGARATEANIAKTRGGLGQQYVVRKPVPGQQYTFGDRLPAVSPLSLAKTSEFDPDPALMGFVKDPYWRGFSVANFISGAMSARKTMTDTSQGTADTGYSARKLQMCLGSMLVYQDGTVRDPKGRIVMWTYGPQSFDPTMMVGSGDEATFVDVNSLAKEIQSEYGTIRQAGLDHNRRL